VGELIELIMREDRERSQFYELVVRNAIATLVVILLRKAALLPLPATPSLLQKTAAYAHGRFRENISLSQIAEELSVTPNYLGKRFSQWMGVSFSDYLNTVRLRHACHLLAGTELSVKEIAFSSGYNSIEHFEYSFKKKMTCSPTVFRRQSREGRLSREV
jgi:AraC-like DNA-binding protein